jgi:hypothetical protein
MNIASKSSGLRHARSLWFVIATALLMPGCLWGGDVLASAQPSTSGADLAQHYLAALGPAGRAISTAETQLKALPITASVAQVKAVVASLPTALGPLEALVKSGAPSPRGTSLESLGNPTILGQNGLKCSSYTTPALGGQLIVNNTLFRDGFQMITPAPCYNSERNAEWTWQIGTKYTNLTAQFGYDLSNSCRGLAATLIKFLGNDGEPLPFKFNGQFTQAVGIRKVLQSVSVNLANQTQLTVQIVLNINYVCASYVDILNDQLS